MVEYDRREKEELKRLNEQITKQDGIEHKPKPDTNNRQRWQAPDVPEELAKRVICACIREICFFRFSMGPKSHKFSTSLLTRHLYTRELVTELSERADFMTAQQCQGFCR